MNDKVNVKLLKGLLDIIVLRIVATTPLHGYSIIINIKKRFGVYFGPSTIYPLLNVLEKEGLVKSDWQLNSKRPRKVYSSTALGNTELERWLSNLRMIVVKTGLDIEVRQPMIVAQPQA
jgi:PadR family transcriptional regulator PadR